MKGYIRTVQSVTAMAYERKEILDTAFRYSEGIQEHILKCVIYSKNHRDYKPWVDEELTIYFTEINNMKPKKGLTVKDVDYRKNLFSAFGDELEDAKREVQAFYRKFVKTHPDPYPDFKITPELYERYFRAWQDLRDSLYTKIGKYPKASSKKEIARDIHFSLDKYCTSSPWLN